jgi:hypothetical protein
MPHDVLPPQADALPLQRLGNDDSHSFARSGSWANISGNPREIFQPQATRAGNAFLNIQQALNNDRASAHVLDSITAQQQRIKSTQNYPIVHARKIQLQKPFARPLMSGAPMEGIIGDVQRASADGNSSFDDEDDDFDYFKHCGPSHYDTIHSSRIPIARNSQTPSEVTWSAVRNWVKCFSPHELVSVDAACSIFSPGSNWPGNANYKQSEMDFQNKRLLRATQHTITSLVLRAEAEKSLSLRHSCNNVTLDPRAVSQPHIQAQSKTSPTSRPSQPLIQHSKLMPPPTPPDQKPKCLSSASASKRPRGFRVDKPLASVGAYLNVLHKLSLHSFVSYCSCS